MLTFTQAEVSVYYAARVPALRQRGKEWRGTCPLHRGKRENFAVNPATGQWFCHSKCGNGGDILNLEMTLRGTDFETAVVDVRHIVGVSAPDRIYRDSQRSKRRLGPIVATYDYRDEQGRLLYQCVRHEPKDFTQRRPGRNGWIWSVA